MTFGSDQEEKCTQNRGAGGYFGINFGTKIILWTLYHKSLAVTCRKAVAYFGLGYQARAHLPAVWQQCIAYVLILMLFAFTVLRRAKW